MGDHATASPVPINGMASRRVLVLNSGVCHGASKREKRQPATKQITLRGRIMCRPHGCERPGQCWFAENRGRRCGVNERPVHRSRRGIIVLAMDHTINDGAVQGRIRIPTGSQSQPVWYGISAWRPGSTAPAIRASTSQAAQGRPIRKTRQTSPPGASCGTERTEYQQ